MNKQTDTIDKLRGQVQSILKIVDELGSVGSSQDLGDLPYRVIHLKDNPSRLAAKAQEFELDRLRKENERLRARLDILECGDYANVTTQIDMAVKNANLIGDMTSKLDEYKKREEKILDSFRKTSRNYRRAVSSLTGFKMDALKDGLYNLYVDGNDYQHLSFKMFPDGNIRLIDGDLGNQYAHLRETYVDMADSFPAFLAAITLDLFKSTTQMEPMSMCLSTTIRPNPDFEEDYLPSRPPNYD